MGFLRRTRTPDTRTEPIDVRDPRSATVNVNRTSPGAPMVPEWNAEEAIRFAYVANVYVWACIQVRAKALAGLPFRAGKDPTKPHEFNPNAPLATLLGPPPGGPSRTVSARRLWAWTVAQQLTAGRFAWELENPTETSSKVVGLWPLPAHLLEPIPSAGGSRYFDGYLFGRNSGNAQARRRLTADQVLYDWTPSALDFRQPESPLQAARLDISVAVMQDRYDHAFLKNDMTPAAIMVHREFAELDEREAFRAQLTSSHRGPDNAGKTMFVEAGPGDEDLDQVFHYKVLGLTQRDAETIRRYEQKIKAICVALGVPMSILGDASGKTFANAGEEWRGFWENTMLPHCADLQDAINMQLAPRLGTEVGWFDLSEVAALKAASKIVALGSSVTQLVDAGIMSINEVRAEFDLGEIPGGDVYVDPMAGVPTSAPVVPVEPVAPTPAATAPEAAAKPAVPPATPARAIQVEAPKLELVAPGDKPTFIARGVEAEKRAAHSTAQAARWTAVDATTRLLEKRWIPPMSRVLAQVGKDAAAALEDKTRHIKTLHRKALKDERVDPAWAAIHANGLTMQLVDRDALARTIAETATPLYAAVVRSASAHLPTRTKRDTPKLPTGRPKGDVAAAVDRIVKQRANDLAGHVADTTVQIMRDALAAGIEEGESIPKLAARVQDAMGPLASKKRATTIARTETVSAFNGATRDLAVERDVADQFEWISTLDQRTRPDHADANGQTIDPDGAFDVGGESLQYPGDPGGSPENVVNCRCTLGAVNEFSPRSVDPDELRRLIIEVGLGRRDALDTIHELQAVA